MRQAQPAHASLYCLFRREKSLDMVPVMQVAHAAVALMDATVAAGGRPSDALEGLFIAACLRIAAANEGGYVPSPDEAAVLFGSNGAS
jgi:hypothetical protein